MDETLDFQTWLSQIGFVRGNPFTKKTAEAEEAELHKYFVEPTHFSQISSSASETVTTIYYASRGNGKTATARMVQYWLTEAKKHSVLVVNFNRVAFDKLFNRIGNQFSAISRFHYRELLLELSLKIAQEQYKDLSYQTHYEDLPDLAAKLHLQGIESIYILVDGLDEFEETSFDPELATNIIAPLMTDLYLLEMQYLSFKFFLPLEVEKPLNQRPSFRGDRFVQLSGRNGWNERDLSNLLEQRLRYYSGNKISQLASISDMQDLDKHLINSAMGSPRKLIRLGDYLLEEYYRNEKSTRLSRASLEAALTRFQQQEDNLHGSETALESQPVIEIPPIRVCESAVFIGKLPMKPNPSRTELTLLQTLYEKRGGVCTREYMLEKFHIEDKKNNKTKKESSESMAPEPEDEDIYDPDDYIESVDSALKRLKRKLGKHADDYIKNIRGTGWRLENYA